MNPYATDKALCHADRLAVLKAGGHPAPVHLQLIPSNVCNHHCTFCLTEGAIIDTLSGAKSIAEIVVGDRVWGPDGGIHEVSEVSDRVVQEVYRIDVDGRIIEASAGHPILTVEGWKTADRIRVGDAAVVRVRVRGAGCESSGNVESLPAESSAERSERPSGALQAHRREDAKGQSDAPASGSRSGFREHEGQAESEVTGRHCKNCSSGTEEDAFRSEPDARSVETPAGDREVSRPAYLEDGIELQAVGIGIGTASGAFGLWNSLDRQAQSGLPRCRPEEGPRTHAEGVLRWLPQEQEHSFLRNPDHRSLRGEGLEVPRGVHEGSGAADRGAESEDSRLHFQGQPLERGLELRPVRSVSLIAGKRRVFNFTCLPGHAYEANGIVVHNCAYRMPGYTSAECFDERGAMRTMKAVEILESGANLGIKAVQFTGGGEPTVHRDLHTMFSVARNLGLETALVTNGQLLHDGILVSLLTSSWVRISLDAGTEQTYRRIRGVREGVFGGVLHNVHNLVQRRNDSGSSLYVGLSFLVTPENWTEVPLAVEIAERLEVDNLRLSAVFTTVDDGYYDGFGDEAAALCSQAAGARPNGLLVSDNFSVRRSDLKQGPPDYPRCLYQHLTTYVGADLNLYRCCLLAYNPRGRLGSLADRSLSDLWNDPTTISLLKALNPAACVRCQFNDRNRAIRQVMDAIPERHGNFV